MEKNILSLEKITKIYSKEMPKALDNINFEFENGLYGLLGPNGSGKSTLMNIVVGALKETSGEILWNQSNVVKNRKNFYRILGFMPQQQNLYPSFTGRQILKYFCALKEVQKEHVIDEINKVSRIVNLETELDKRVSKYSGGMKQRLILAQALLNSPQLLILDEPTAGLDPKERIRLRNKLQEMSKESVVIIATHVIQDVEDVANQIILLKKGVIVNSGSISELKNEHNVNSLEELYLSVFGDV